MKPNVRKNATKPKRIAMDGHSQTSSKPNASSRNLLAGRDAPDEMVILAESLATWSVRSA